MFPNAGLVKISQKKLVNLHHLAKAFFHLFPFNFLITTGGAIHKVSYTMMRWFIKIFKSLGYEIWEDMG
jgi:hypothetical protein